MDGPTLFGKLLDKRGVNPNSLAAALKTPKAQSTFHRFKEGLTKQPKRESLEGAAKYLGVNVLAFFDPRLADEEWARISGDAPPPAAPPKPEKQQFAPHPPRFVSESEWALLQDFALLQDDEKHTLRSRLAEKANEARRKADEMFFGKHKIPPPVTNERVEEALPAPPTGAGSWQRITPVPEAPKPSKKKEK